MTTAETRCPFCQTQIKISARLIETANHSVRCGSCLRLFDTVPSATPDSVSEPLTAAGQAAALDSALSDSGHPNAETSTAAVRTRALSTDYSLLSGDGLEPLKTTQLPLIDSAPIEMAAKPMTARYGITKTAASVLTLFLLVVALAAQYLWYNRSLYQHSPRLYPFFVSSCSLFDCSIPPFVDIAALRGEELTVVSGSEGGSTLVVSFALYNSARLEQAAPVLILSFNTAAQRSVALREFAPADYLPGPINLGRALGAGERVNIRLELIDPGADAVNYTVAFRSL